MGRWRLWNVAAACVVMAVVGSEVRGEETVIDTTAETVLADAPTHATCAVADHRGNVWIGNEDGFLACYHLASRQWTRYTQKDGLGDEVVYALCCDRQGRIWAGHLNHGVSVFNGESWRNYSNFGKNAGPLGARVFAIAESPADGDVWIATEAGISRYSEKGGTWTYYTRAEGLPEEGVRGIAFTRNGDAYLAMATEGVVIGRAADGFKQWEQVKGPAAMPRTATGEGLPSGLTNCVAVDDRDHVYVGTTQGMARSNDAGRSWRFVRGKDWIDMVNGQSAEGEKISAGEPGVLNEDWVNTIVPDASGTLWIGYRKQGYQRLELATNAVILSETEPVAPTPKPEGGVHRYTNNVAAIVANGVGEQPLICRYEVPAAWCTAADAKLAPSTAAREEKAAAFPAAAAPVTADAIAGMTAALRTLPSAETHVEYLGEDWMTQGDWVGRYGRDRAFILGVSDKAAAYGKEGVYGEEVGVGVHNESGPFYWYVDGEEAQERRVLWNPEGGKRAQGELNDGSFNEENLPATMEGPGMWMRITAPAGAHRLALYFGNYDAHSGRNAYRDFVLEVRQQPDAANGEAPAGVEAVLSQPVLARARVSNYRGGVYERFLLSSSRDETTYWIRIKRNHSFVTKVQAIFLDRLAPRDDAEGAQTAFDPPPFTESSTAPADSIVGRAVALQHQIDKSWYRTGIACSVPFQLKAYRAMEAADAPEGLLAQWRWAMPLWTKGDEALFAARMKSDYEKSHGGAAGEQPVAP